MESSSSQPVIEPEPTSLISTAESSTQTDPPPKRKATPGQVQALAAARDRYNAGRTHLKMEKLRLKLLGYGLATHAPAPMAVTSVPAPAPVHAPPRPAQNYVRFC